MAEPPIPLDALVDAYGPHLNYAPPGGWAEASRRPPDRLVKTHCSFCGMQCGIQLKVLDEKVVGFEPWEEFPFNRGMLCPKGVKRYLQGEHPDRLKQCVIRTAGGFKPITYEEALKHVSNPDDFALRFRGISSTSDGTWEDFDKAEEEKAESQPAPAPAAAAGDDFKIDRF